ncbi:hypothetical protein CKO12_13625 [Chromatium okenii]|uniref:hypothetical protein n=1 Tax=Chromatium okenii TaxID=61644 RepID=UPI0019073FA4|nr:hypothetical protein [Chromatium okenii]MBK1642888.1 hypothetical protein [Chromatium okenii]
MIELIFKLIKASAYALIIFVAIVGVGVAIDGSSIWPLFAILTASVVFIKVVSTREDTKIVDPATTKSVQPEVESEQSVTTRDTVTVQPKEVQQTIVKDRKTIVCSNCGANVVLEEGKGVCPYCDTIY